MLDLTTWPAGMRVIIRREHPHPGAALSLFEEADGWRYQAVATNTPLATGGQVAFLEARHRAHARVETRIRHAKDTGIGRFPSREYAINESWLIATSIAADLIAWLRLLALPEKLKACEPKALRYRLLHVPARLAHGARQRRLRFPGHLALGAGHPRRVHRDPRPDPAADLRPATSPVHPRASTTRRPAPQRHAAHQHARTGKPGVIVGDRPSPTRCPTRSSRSEPHPGEDGRRERIRLGLVDVVSGGDAHQGAVRLKRWRRRSAGPAECRWPVLRR